MSQIVAGGSKKSYGSTGESRIPDVNFSGAQFSPTEMYDLSDKISSSISAINACYKTLDQSFKVIGTPKDGVDVRNKLHDMQSKTNEHIAQITKDLHRLAVIVRRGDKKQKLHVDKLTTNFKEAVQSYSSIQKKVADKLKTHILPSQHVQPSYDDEVSRDESSNLMKQEQINRELEFEKGLLIEREQRIHQIEDVIVDVNKIMRELAAIVIQQGENINSIEDMIESAQSNAESGLSELEKASTYQDKRRRKTCILLGISVIIGLILAISIAITLK